jgi:WD40 repeat protein
VLNEIPIASADGATVWMNIRNPKTNKYLTDEVSSVPDMNFILESQSNSQAQQWKIIAKENGNVEFVNRATGNLISTVTNLDKYYYVDYTVDPAGNTGWKYALASDGDVQYEVYTTDDGVISYWNATTNGQAPDVYSTGNTANSTYAWIFSWVDETRTGIHPPLVSDNIRVYSENKRIYVEGCDEYRVITVSGMPVRKNIELPIGIYLVTVKGKTTKILVK